jgi:hypothetical protein
MGQILGCIPRRIRRFFELAVPVLALLTALALLTGCGRGKAAANSAATAAATATAQPAASVPPTMNAREAANVPHNAVGIAQLLGCPQRVSSAEDDLTATNVMPVDQGSLNTDEVWCILYIHGIDYGQIYVYTFPSAANVREWTTPSPTAAFEGNGGGNLVVGSFWVVDSNAPNDYGAHYVQQKLGGRIQPYIGNGTS